MIALGKGDQVCRSMVRHRKVYDDDPGAESYKAAAGAMKALWALESCAQESRPTQRRGAAMRIANIE